MESYFSDKATFFNTTDDFGSGIVPCLNDETAPSCDWGRIFSTNLPPDLKNSSVNIGVISYRVPNVRNSQARVWCDSVTYIGFPTYSLDTSIYSNELHLVQMDGFNISKTPESLIVNPTWFLAAWSVDQNGTVEGSRQIARELTRTLRLYWDDQSDLNTLQLFYYHIYALGMYSCGITPSILTPKSS